MQELEIIRYTPGRKRDWDDFIDRSKNGTFLLRRDYMDYHSDRFADYSLMFLKGESVQAVMPASRSGSVVSAHGGLTYGGYIMSRKATTDDTLRFFGMLAGMLRADGVSELLVKPVPHIYHSIPAEEDLYALFRLNATLAVRNVSAAVCMSGRMPFRSIRKAGARKAAAAGVSVAESADYAAFWDILGRNLADKYGARPVHTLAEISALAARFPDNIKLWLARDAAGTAVAGTVLFVTPLVVHTQYISASPEGKGCGALDLLFSHLIGEVYTGHRYFDFGTSNEDGGRVLNSQLIYQKEGFGAHAICYDTYSLKIR